MNQNIEQSKLEEFKELMDKKFFTLSRFPNSPSSVEDILTEFRKTIEHLLEQREVKPVFICYLPIGEYSTYSIQVFEYTEKRLQELLSDQYKVIVTSNTLSNNVRFEVLNAKNVDEVEFKELSEKVKNSLKEAISCIPEKPLEGE